MANADHNEVTYVSVVHGNGVIHLVHHWDLACSLLKGDIPASSLLKPRVLEGDIPASSLLEPQHLAPENGTCVSEEHNNNRVHRASGDDAASFDSKSGKKVRKQRRKRSHAVGEPLVGWEKQNAASLSFSKHTADKTHCKK